MKTYFLIVFCVVSCTKNKSVVVDFTADRTNIVTGNTVNFTDLSVNASTGDYEWTFEGGEPSVQNVQNPSNIKYNAAGTYSVTLKIFRISGVDGLQTKTKTGYITVTQGPTLTDFDGNVYDTIRIGTQVWMKQNLRVTHYKNGYELAAWEQRATYPCIYKLAPPNLNYRYWYNGYAAANSDVAPVGWHIPSDAEWQILIDYLGGVNKAGGEMKTNTSDWGSPNIGATNNSGFSALPAGYLNATYSTHAYLGAYFLSSSGSYYEIQKSSAGIYKQTSSADLFNYCFSIRCILD